MNLSKLQTWITIIPNPTANDPYRYQIYIEIYIDEMLQAGLNDAQKADLQKIWNTHTIEIRSTSTTASGHQTSNLIALDEKSMMFIASITRFFLHSLMIRTSSIDNEDSVTSTESPEFLNKQKSFAYDSLQHLFQMDLKTSRKRKRTGSDISNETFLNPRITQGRHVVRIDHAIFLSAMNNFQKSLQTRQTTQQRTDSFSQSEDSISAFGAFLYHRPHLGICVMNSSLALVLMTLHRKYISSVCNRDRLHLSPSLITIPPETIMIATRFYNVYPMVEIQDVKTSNAYKFITLQGRIIKVYPKRLRLLTSDVRCLKCGQHFEHLFQDGIYTLPSRCIASENCRGQKFELVRQTAKYLDYQMLKLQEEESMSSTTAGRTPRHIELEVTHELVNQCVAGDHVKVVGVIKAVNSAVKSGRVGKRASETSTYHLHMVVNSIVNTTAELDRNNKGVGEQNQDDHENELRGGLTFSDHQLEKIIKVAHADHMIGDMHMRMAFPFDLLVNSLCPSIIGRHMVKAGILLSLLGGTPSSGGLEDVRSGVSIRSSIHCLIVGDPGMGKSCMLLATSQVAARSIYVGGNTSSTTGLTVSLSRESGGEVGIEAGALVLADNGVCCIDEFDKMAKTNQDGLLEAMEQQQISIAKAGVVASLPARCCVIAAANPKKGKYDLNRTVAENLNVSPPLLSRFDLVFILRDEVDTDEDKKVAENILSLYKDSNQYNQSAIGHVIVSQQNDELSQRITMKKRLEWISQTQKPLPRDIVKDYLTYAREYCKPKMTPEAAAVLKEYFMTLRYPEHGKRNDSMPITTRQLEALIRLSQARAKACLREFVLKEDAYDVVELMRDSVNQVHMDSTGNLDRTRGGVIGKSKRAQKKLLIDSLKQSSQVSFSKDDLYRFASQLDLQLHDFWVMIDELRFSDQPELRKGSDGLFYVL